MNIIERRYFENYRLLIGDQLKSFVDSFDFIGNNDNSDYQVQASAVYSSNIEGNTIDLNSFMNYKLSRAKIKPQKELQEIEDLISAYSFARQNPLNEKHFLKAHQILSKQFLIKGSRGKYRNDRVGLFGQSGLVYLAIEAQFIVKAMNNLFREISLLLARELSLDETFYFASLIHLRIAHLHPFTDGNGRAVRLLEKWFLTQKLNPRFWTIPSEKYYKDHQQEYYDNINLGLNYYELDYERCLPFLMMLPHCLRQ